VVPSASGVDNHCSHRQEPVTQRHKTLNLRSVEFITTSLRIILSLCFNSRCHQSLRLYGVAWLDESV